MFRLSRRAVLVRAARSSIVVGAGALGGGAVHFGRHSARAATEVPPIANLMFLPLLPGDVGEEGFGIDYSLGGIARHALTPAGLEHLAEPLRAALPQDFRRGYVGSIAKSVSGNDVAAAKAMTTTVIDLGSRAAAKTAFTDYAVALETLGAFKEGGGPKLGEGTAYYGLSNNLEPGLGLTYASGQSYGGLIVLFRREHFLVDLRVREFTGAGVTAEEAGAFAGVVDAKTAAVAGKGDAPEGFDLAAALLPPAPVFVVPGADPPVASNEGFLALDGRLTPMFTLPVDATLEANLERDGIRHLMSVIGLIVRPPEYREEYGLRTICETFHFLSVDARTEWFERERDAEPEVVENQTIKKLGGDDKRAASIETYVAPQGPSYFLYHAVTIGPDTPNPIAIRTTIQTFPADYQAASKTLTETRIKRDFAPLADEMGDAMVAGLANPDDYAAVVTLGTNPAVS